MGKLKRTRVLQPKGQTSKKSKKTETWECNIDAVSRTTRGETNAQGLDTTHPLVFASISFSLHLQKKKKTQKKEKCLYVIFFKQNKLKTQVDFSSNPFCFHSNK